MAVIKVALLTRNKMAQDLIDDLDAGGGPAVIEFFTAPQPAGPDTAVTTQTKLGTLVCTDPCASKDNGVITFAAVAQDSAADATGLAAWARLSTSTGGAVVDLDVSDEAGDGSIKLNTVGIVAGGPILMNSLVFTIGGA